MKHRVRDIQDGRRERDRDRDGERESNDTHAGMRGEEIVISVKEVFVQRHMNMSDVDDRSSVQSDNEQGRREPCTAVSTR